MLLIKPITDVLPENNLRTKFAHKCFHFFRSMQNVDLMLITQQPLIKFLFVCLFMIFRFCFFDCEIRKSFPINYFT